MFLILTDTILYIHGPLKIAKGFCHLHVFVSSTIMMHAMLLLDAVIVVKYIFIFFMKNPTAIQEDFWKVITSVGDDLLNFGRELFYPRQSLKEIRPYFKPLCDLLNMHIINY